MHCRLNNGINFSSILFKGIRELTEEQLEEYQKDPGNFTVKGVKLLEGELKIQFTLSSKENGDAKGCASKYEADCSGDVLVLLDVKPDSVMMNEGLAREVVNRVQKLRKQAKLVPTDVVSVFYSLSGGDNQVKESIETNIGYISSSLKAPFSLLTEKGLNGRKVIIEDIQSLKETTLKIVIVDSC
jgi:isoleucyl-tRNA synthetase